MITNNKTIQKIIALILVVALLPFMPITISANNTPGTYNTGDIAVINDLIKNNNLNWEKAPADGSYVPEDWLSKYGIVYMLWSEDLSDKRIKFLCLYQDDLVGELDVRGLASLEYFSCHNNKLTSIDISGLTALKEMTISNNTMISADDIIGWKKLGLFAAENGEYPISGRFRLLLMRINPLPNGMVGQNYNVDSLQGYYPDTINDGYSLTNGLPLPDGLTLNSYTSYIISGTPTVAGTFIFVICGCHRFGFIGDDYAYTSRVFSITIEEPPSPTNDYNYSQLRDLLHKLFDLLYTIKCIFQRIVSTASYIV